MAVVKPPLFLLTKRSWSGMEHIPAEGGLIIAANHLSEFDPLIISHFVNDAGRWPQFLAKSSLFSVPGLGSFLRWCKQIPVHRGTADAAKSLDAAAAAILAGEGVIIYPEGTTPKSGDLWPERGKTGVARLFLRTGAPVVPVVSWGPQRLLDPRTRKFTLRPRTPVTVIAGPPIDLSKWEGAEPTAANLYAITDEIMTVLRDMLSQIRGESVPVRPGNAPSGALGGGAGGDGRGGIDGGGEGGSRA
ncbi:lysophospholipid acyltransferase family protein [Rugosimonospora acidiphila]|uniref:lysophospholipid acyltransferase family protein n=1 Tax=Rugosimonospora acidiphila TaxID=556531 RepID=UPI003CD0794D